jgi:hypothetical protein
VDKLIIISNLRSSGVNTGSVSSSSQEVVERRIFPGVGEMVVGEISWELRDEGITDMDSMV